MERTAEQVARIVRKCLNEGRQVEIDGLGTFRRRPEGEFEFLPSSAPMVFLAYVQEDGPAAERLFEALKGHEFDPWLDRRKLMPGQNWPRAIEHAIARSDHFLACFSHKSAYKRGQFQAELRYALDCAARMPLDRIFFIPVRLEDCEVPWAIRRELQYVDLFPDWERGFRRLLSVMRREQKSLRLAG